MSASTPDNLTALLSALLDGSITPEDHATLAARLRTDPTARAAYHNAVELQSLLHWQHSDRAAQPIAIPDTSTAPHKPDAEARRGVGIFPQSKIGNRQSAISRPTPFIIYPIAIAAAALLTAAIVVVYLLALTTTADPQPDPIKPNQPGPAVATLIEVSGGGDLTTPHGYPAEGDDFSAGEYTLTSGGAEFMLTNAVNVKLRGETRMLMRNNMNVALSHGSAAFVVPKDANGFTVHLPDGSRVVDLGTAFRVTVDEEGRPSVVVSNGSVRVEHGVGGEQRVLRAGQSVALTANGYREQVEHRVKIAGRIDANTNAAEQIVATFGPDELVPGDTVVVDLDVEPLEPAAQHNWFVIAVNPRGYMGWTKAATGGLLRTDRVTDFAAHQFVHNGVVADLGEYTDKGGAEGGGRIRLEISPTLGFDATAKFSLHIDDDRDGTFEHTTEGQFQLGDQLNIGLAATGGTHQYRAVDEANDKKKPFTPTEIPDESSAQPEPHDSASPPR